MHVRAALLAVTAAALLPLGGTSHASCLDDAQATWGNGYTASPKSPYASSGYVHWNGTATVAVYGDALASDTVATAGDWVRWTQVHATNAPGVTTAFVNCVAG